MERTTIALALIAVATVVAGRMLLRALFESDDEIHTDFETLTRRNER